MFRPSLPGYACKAFLVVVLCGLCFVSENAFAQRNQPAGRPDATPKEKRVALVIGNGSYKDSPLKNPVNDAADMAAKLRTLGFEVIERRNLTTRQIGPTLREFRSKLVPGAVAVVFYAGHGLQIRGENYLPAVDAEIAGEEDVHNQSLAVKQLMDILDNVKTQLNLVFLDACRNNPYARSFRSAGEGLAKLTAPSGTLISFATRPGSVAADGEGRNGLYTSSLLEQMNYTSVPIEQILKRVVVGVKAASNGRQEPWMEGSIEGDFCFGTCEQAAPAASALVTAQAASATASAQVAYELAFWDAIKNSSNPADFDAYLRRYPDGQFVDLARNRLDGLRQRDTTERDRQEQARRDANEAKARADKQTLDAANKPTQQASDRERVQLAVAQPSPARVALPAAQPNPIGTSVASALCDGATAPPLLEVAVRDFGITLFDGSASVRLMNKETGGYQLESTVGDRKIRIEPFLVAPGAVLKTGEKIDLCRLKQGLRFTFASLLPGIEITTTGTVKAMTTRSVAGVGDISVYEIELVDKLLATSGDRRNPNSGIRTLEYAPALGVALKISTRLIEQYSFYGVGSPYNFTSYAVEKLN